MGKKSKVYKDKYGNIKVYSCAFCRNMHFISEKYVRLHQLEYHSKKKPKLDFQLDNFGNYIVPTPSSRANKDKKRRHNNPDYHQDTKGKDSDSHYGKSSESDMLETLETGNNKTMNKVTQSENYDKRGGGSENPEERTSPTLEEDERRGDLIEETGEFIQLFRTSDRGSKCDKSSPKKNCVSMSEVSLSQAPEESIVEMEVEADSVDETINLVKEVDRNSANPIEIDRSELQRNVTNLLYQRCSELKDPDSPESAEADDDDDDIRIVAHIPPKRRKLVNMVTVKLEPDTHSEIQREKVSNDFGKAQQELKDRPQTLPSITDPIEISQHRPPIANALPLSELAANIPIGPVRSVKSALEDTHNHQSPPSNLKKSIKKPLTPTSKGKSKRKTGGRKAKPLTSCHFCSTQLVDPVERSALMERYKMFPASCLECTEEFSDLELYLSIKTSLFTGKTYRCGECNIPCKSLISGMNHLKVHTKDVPFDLKPNKDLYVVKVIEGTGLKRSRSGVKLEPVNKDSHPTQNSTAAETKRIGHDKNESGINSATKEFEKNMPPATATATVKPSKTSTPASDKAKFPADRKGDSNTMSLNTRGSNLREFKCRQFGCSKTFRSEPLLKEHAKAHVLNIKALWVKRKTT